MNINPNVIRFLKVVNSGISQYTCVIPCDGWINNAAYDATTDILETLTAATLSVNTELSDNAA